MLYALFGLVGIVNNTFVQFDTSVVSYYTGYMDGGAGGFGPNTTQLFKPIGCGITTISASPVVFYCINNTVLDPFVGSSAVINGYDIYDYPYIRADFTTTGLYVFI